MRRKKDNLLTADEVAKIFKVNRVTLWRWNRDGILNACKVGRNVRYKYSEVIKALK